jgi:hypothetical protein
MTLMRNIFIGTILVVLPSCSSGTVESEQATATVGYTLTATTVDEAGTPLDQRTEDFLSFVLQWEHVDGVWNLIDVVAPGTGFDLMALNLFMFGVPPSEYFALDH